MLASVSYVLFWIFPAIFHSGTCGPAEAIQPYLTLYPPGEPEYTDVLVRRTGDNLTLVCELQGAAAPRLFVWNFVPQDNTSIVHSPYTTEPRLPELSSRYTKLSLQPEDSGHYVCAAPPFSTAKFILVQTRGPKQCARGAFWCGKHCVLASYVCDGFRDCVRGEDEAPSLCLHQPCSRPDKLNCSSGRCISAAACCAGEGAGRCASQPACCDEHPRFNRLEGFVDVEYPPLFEDRHAPDEYSFIQSTIYTVTACALIFMIAVVLLVSAICKMHMKRAALRSYTHAARHHYAQAQTHRFPPCYEASRLLEAERAEPPPPALSPPGSPANTPLQCGAECPPSPEARGLARLSQIFSGRYRQVPTQCLDVEMTVVRSASCTSSPTRNRPRTHLEHYRSPTYADLNNDLFFNTEMTNCGRDLNYMATPMEFYRRRTLRSNLDRVLDQINRPRPLTLQLGRFQLSIPRFGRQSPDRRPDTPNITELNIDDLDFVRLNSNDTYTLNGRTIRLLGANFENYPVLNDANHPPPYTEAMRYKLYGPPPEYLSRDALNTERDENIQVTEERARSNIEMPPCYDDLASGGDNANNNVVTVAAVTENVNSNSDNQNNVTSTNSSHNNVTSSNSVPQNNVTSINSDCTNSNVTNLSSVIDNLPAIDSDVNANDTDTRYNVDNNVITNNNEVNA